MQHYCLSMGLWQFKSLYTPEQPTLSWAAATDSNAPFAFYNDQNQLVGFEKELIEAVAREMGRVPKFVPNNWDGLIPGLQRGLYDCVICGIEIIPAKAREVLFSNPYYVTFEQYVDRKGSPPIHSLAELKGKTVGSPDQTSAMNMLQCIPGVIVTNPTAKR